MKTLIVRLSQNEISGIRQVPDSALLQGGRPLFLPEDAETANLSIMPAVRICRLGLGIAPQFATRYFDAATLVALNLPSPGAEPSDFDLVADNSLVAGRWSAIPADGKWTVGLPGHDTLTCTIGDAFSRAIAGISRRATFKTGDIIVLDNFICKTIAAPVDSRISCTLNNEEILSFKIK